MRPLLKSGKYILVKRAPYYKPGDIICYRRNGKNYIHRIIKHRKNIFTVVDDAGVCDYHRIKLKNIVGKATGKWNAGILGVLYCLFTRIIFKIGRGVKKFFINHEVKLKGWNFKKEKNDER